MICDGQPLFPITKTQNLTEELTKSHLRQRENRGLDLMIPLINKIENLQKTTHASSDE